MEEKTTLGRSWRAIGLAVGLVCVVSAGSALWLPHSKSNTQDGLPQVKNETASFQLVSEEKRGSFLVVKVRNISGKGITAYSVSLGRSSRQDMDYCISGYTIEPGSTEEIEFPLSDLDVTDTSNGKRTQIRILSVIFADRTSDGDRGVAAMIQDRRLGKKIQLKRINRMIRDALASGDANLSSALDTLKAGIGLLSEGPDGKEQSSYVNSGLHDAKVDVLRLIERFEQNERAKTLGVADETQRGHLLRESLNKVVQESEKWVDRY